MILSIGSGPGGRRFKSFRSLIFIELFITLMIIMMMER